jgi:hypothetical protein
VSKGGYFVSMGKFSRCRRSGSGCGRLGQPSFHGDARRRAKQLACHYLSAEQGIFRRKFSLERHQSAPNRLGGRTLGTTIKAWTDQNHFFDFFPPDFLLPADFLDAEPLDFLAEDLLAPFFDFWTWPPPPPLGAALPAPPPEEEIT